MTKQPIKLTIDSAHEYVFNHLTNLGYEDVVILRSTKGKECGVDVIDVWFTYRTIDGLTSPVHNFTVWIENDKLYGEW